MKLTIHEYFVNGMWDISGEMGDGDAIQYFHGANVDHDKAVEEVKEQAKTFKTYDVEI